MITLAPKGEILYFVAFLDRSTARRIIRLRRAYRREAKHYFKATDETPRANPNS
jgi:uncharacterized DUF497 family protein